MGTFGSGAVTLAGEEDDEEEECCEVNRLPPLLEDEVRDRVLRMNLYCSTDSDRYNGI